MGFPSRAHAWNRMRLEAMGPWSNFKTSRAGKSSAANACSRRSRSDGPRRGRCRRAGAARASAQHRNCAEVRRRPVPPSPTLAGSEAGHGPRHAAPPLAQHFQELCAYSFAGPFMGEEFSEVQPPARSARVTTPLGAPLLGGALSRLPRLILDAGGYKPSAWREFFSFVFNPMGG